MGISGKESTIDRNGAGGDAGVTEKRNAALAKLNKIHQTGMPDTDGKAIRTGRGVVGGQPKQGGSPFKGGGKPSAQKSVPGGHKKQ